MLVYLNHTGTSFQVLIGACRCTCTPTQAFDLTGSLWHVLKCSQSFYRNTSIVFARDARKCLQGRRILASSLILVKEVTTKEPITTSKTTEVTLPVTEDWNPPSSQDLQFAHAGTGVAAPRGRQRSADAPVVVHLQQPQQGECPVVRPLARQRSLRKQCAVSQCLLVRPPRQAMSTHMDTSHGLIVQLQTGP